MSTPHSFFLEQVVTFTQHLWEKFQLIPRIGGELEFYLRSDYPEDIERVLTTLSEHCDRVEPERGWHQYECVFSHNMQPLDLAKQMHEIKNVINFNAKRHLCQASFAAKPFPEDYGSAMHFHLSLHDEYGTNVFAEKSIGENPWLPKVIAGILDVAPELVYLLCKEAEDYERFVEKFLAPTHVAWGANNRTTILRIPDSDPHQRRLEFRLPPACCNTATAIFGLLVGVVHGLSNNLNLPERIYGNAFDQQYSLPRLPNTLQDAQIAFANGGKVLYYMQALTPNLRPDSVV